MKLHFKLHPFCLAQLLLLQPFCCCCKLPINSVSRSRLSYIYYRRKPSNISPRNVPLNTSTTFSSYHVLLFKQTLWLQHNCPVQLRVQILCKRAPTCKDISHLTSWTRNSSWWKYESTLVAWNKMPNCYMCMFTRFILGWNSVQYLLRLLSSSASGEPVMNGPSVFLQFICNDIPVECHVCHFDDHCWRASTLHCIFVLSQPQGNRHCKNLNLIISMKLQWETLLHWVWWNLMGLWFYWLITLMAHFASAF